MEKIPTAEEFLDLQHKNVPSIEFDIREVMIEFAKLHVEAALEEAANEYYPRTKENFELVADRFLNAYPLTNIK
jgi:hypothetical protein